MSLARARRGFSLRHPLAASGVLSLCRSMGRSSRQEIGDWLGWGCGRYVPVPVFPEVAWTLGGGTRMLDQELRMGRTLLLVLLGSLVVMAPVAAGPTAPEAHALGEFYPDRSEGEIRRVGSIAGLHVPLGNLPAGARAHPTHTPARASPRLPPHASTTSARTSSPAFFLALRSRHCSSRS